MMRSRASRAWLAAAILVVWGWLVYRWVFALGMGIPWWGLALVLVSVGVGILLAHVLWIDPIARGIERAYQRLRHRGTGG
jgi:hypothetical protein